MRDRYALWDGTEPIGCLGGRRSPATVVDWDAKRGGPRQPRGGSTGGEGSGDASKLSAPDQSDPKASDEAAAKNDAVSDADDETQAEWEAEAELLEDIFEPAPTATPREFQRSSIEIPVSYYYLTGLEPPPTRPVTRLPPGQLVEIGHSVHTAPAAPPTITRPCDWNLAPIERPVAATGCLTIDSAVIFHEDDCPTPPVGCGVCGYTYAADSGNLLVQGGTGHFSESEEDFLNSAWNLLQDNHDLAEWVTCLMWGSAAVECISNAIATNNQIIEAEEGPNWWPLCFPTPSACMLISEPFTGRIEIDITNADWIALAAEFTSSDVDISTCAVARMAAVLFHELLHGCIHTGKDVGIAHDMPNTQCDKVYAAESAFKWALAQRYPCLASAGSCSNYLEDCMWMWDTQGDCP